MLWGQVPGLLTLGVCSLLLTNPKGQCGDAGRACVLGSLVKEVFRLA